MGNRFIAALSKGGTSQVSQAQQKPVKENRFIIAIQERQAAAAASAVGPNQPQNQQQAQQQNQPLPQNIQAATPPPSVGPPEPIAGPPATLGALEPPQRGAPERRPGLGLGSGFKPNEQKAFESGMGIGAQNLIEGVVQLGMTVGESLGILDEGVTRAFTQRTSENRDIQRQELQALYPDTESFVSAGETSGEIVLSAAVPGGVTGGLLRRAATGVLSSGLIGATQFVEEGESRAQNITIAATIGVLGQGATEAVKLGGRLLSSGGAVKELSKNVTDFATRQRALGTNKSSEALIAAAKRQDIPLTTSQQQLDNPRLTAIETHMRPSEKQLADMDSLLKGVEVKSKKKLNDLLEGIVPEGTQAAREARGALYAKVEGVRLPIGLLERMDTDKILQRQAVKAKNSNIVNLAAYDPGTVGFYNEIKKQMDFEINRILTSTQSRSAPTALIESRNNLRTVLSEFAPGYSEALQVSQRLKLQSNLKDKLDKIKFKGQDEVTASQMHDAWFGNPKKTRETLQAIEISGGNVQQAKDMAKILVSIKNSPFSKSLGKAPEALAPTDIQTTITGVVLQKLKKGGHNDAITKLMLDPKAIEEMARIANTKTIPERIIGLLNLIKQSAASQVSDVQ